MIQRWYEPLSFAEWFKRAFSILNIAVFVATAVFVFSEFRFDWFEHVIGSYLTSTNEFRPKKGIIWETGRQTSNAHEYLNQIISRKENTQKNIYGASTFTELANGILPGEWITLETDQFKSLYLSLEKMSASKIIEPSQLVWLLHGSSLNRIFCEGIKGGIKFYFIDSENRVIEQIELKTEQILEIESGESPVEGVLKDMDGFQGRIYTAEDFFKAVFKLPEDIIPDLIVNPEALIGQQGQIVSMGIWNEADHGYIKMGFEFKNRDVRHVVFTKGREWAVWQLSLNLKGVGN